MLRNDLIEAFLQGQKLSLDAMQETPVYIQPTTKTWAWKPNWTSNSHKVGSSCIDLLITLTWHTPSWCPLILKLSCHLVWAHAGWFLHKHCAQHRRYDPGHQWCHSPWRGQEDRKLLWAQFISNDIMKTKRILLFLQQISTYSLGFLFFLSLKVKSKSHVERIKWLLLHSLAAEGSHNSKFVPLNSILQHLILSLEKPFCQQHTSSAS